MGKGAWDSMGGCIIGWRSARITNPSSLEAIQRFLSGGGSATDGGGIVQVMEEEVVGK